MLGIAADIAHTSLYDELHPYMATVNNGDEIHAAALRTPPHNIQVTRAHPAAIEQLVDNVHALYPDLPGVLGPSDAARRFAELWTARTGVAFRSGVAQRIFQLVEVVPVPDVRGRMRAATPDDFELAIEWRMAFDMEAFGRQDREQAERLAQLGITADNRGLCFWEDQQLVSMAGYSGPTPNGMRVGPVYTPPAFRRHGYGSALTAALSQRLIDSGRRFCFLFTDLSNPTSNSIYQRIGYRPVVDVDEYRFTY